MTWTIFSKKTEYESALNRVEELSKNPPSIKSEEGKELLLLGYLIDRYEEEHFPLQYPDPIDAIKVRMSDLGLSLNDLMNIFGDRGTASKVMGGQRALSLNMIRGLRDRLALSSDVLIQPLKLKIRTDKQMAMVSEPKAVYKRAVKSKKAQKS